MFTATAAEPHGGTGRETARSKVKEKSQPLMAEPPVSGTPGLRGVRPLSARQRRPATAPVGAEGATAAASASGTDRAVGAAADSSAQRYKSFTVGWDGFNATLLIRQMPIVMMKRM